MQILGATTLIDGRHIEYRVRRSKSARHRRIRVGVEGIEVVEPASRVAGDAEAFLQANASWVTEQLDRMERLRYVRRGQRVQGGQIFFQGEPTRIWREEVPGRRGGNRVEQHDDAITVITGPGPRADRAARSLERWLRRWARSAITTQTAIVADKLGVEVGRIYIMDQRTKWANCSRLQNLSFSWRIIMAPESVLRYLVTHEVVHLAVPDHSQRFWLTVQSLCPEAERGRQWLAANGARLMVDLEELFNESGTTR